MVGVNTRGTFGNKRTGVLLELKNMTDIYL